MTLPPDAAAFGGERRGLIVDNFAGGGGASCGIEAALGRAIDIAVNHSPRAITMHRANHPSTLHLCENVWQVDPAKVCAGRHVALAWFSPDCTHFSRAKGAKPRSKRTRALAWVVVRWARAVKPAVIMLENVEEFLTWGPLGTDGKPDRGRAGRTFRMWVGKLKALGYKVEWRSLVAADFGAPTTRRRLFLIARCDGRPITWPTPTHGRHAGRPWRTAAEILDWTIPCPSIFERRRPLAEATLKRIAAGLRRYVIESPRPFVVPVRSHGGGGNGARGVDAPLRTVTGANRGEIALVATTVAFLAKHYGTSHGGPHPGVRADEDIGTITARDHHSVVEVQLGLPGVERDSAEASFLTKFYGTSTGADVADPVPTVTATGTHLAEVRAFLVKYYGSSGRPESQQQSLFEPLHTATAKARFGLVVIEGTEYQVVDIGMRMLTPAELFAAQGFPADYELRPKHEGKPLTKTQQIDLAGNSVCPQVAEALVRANLVTACAVRAEAS